MCSLPRLDGAEPDCAGAALPLQGVGGAPGCHGRGAGRCWCAAVEGHLAVMDVVLVGVGAQQ